jgi:4-hydroxybenzoate polyprenyltransferase
MSYLGAVTLAGFSLAFVLLLAANYFLIWSPKPSSALKVLPLFHGAMLVYAVSIIAGLLLP